MSATSWSARRHRVAAIVLALVCATLPVAPSSIGASPAPAPDTSSLTGHWAVAGTSGFDIVQTGSSISGSSVAGITFAGTLSGRRASVRFWSGESFAKADPEDRGAATLDVGPGARELFVSWRNEKTTVRSLDPAFIAVRVVTIIAGPSSEPAPPDFWRAENIGRLMEVAHMLDTPLEIVISNMMVLTMTPAQLRENKPVYEFLLDWCEIWDWQHNIPPRSAWWMRR
jgi:hypothetical protein